MSLIKKLIPIQIGFGFWDMAINPDYETNESELNINSTDKTERALAKSIADINSKNTDNSTKDGKSLKKESTDSRQQKPENIRQRVAVAQDKLDSNRQKSSEAHSSEMQSRDASEEEKDKEISED